MCIGIITKKKRKEDQMHNSLCSLFHSFTFHQTKETKVKDNNKREQPIFLSLCHSNSYLPTVFSFFHLKHYSTIFTLL